MGGVYCCLCTSYDTIAALVTNSPVFPYQSYSVDKGIWHSVRCGSVLARRYVGCNHERKYMVLYKFIEENVLNECAHSPGRAIKTSYAITGDNEEIQD